MIILKNKLFSIISWKAAFLLKKFLKKVRRKKEEKEDKEKVVAKII